MPAIKPSARFARLKPVFRPSKDGADSNLLLLFHGLGDTASNFATFGAKMQLPQTAICALTGPCPIPYFEEGTGWYPAFDALGEEYEPGAVKVQDGLEESRNLIAEFIDECVLGPTGWPAERVFLLGFSQGGSMALDVALLGVRSNGSPLNLGGVVSVSGWLDERSYENGSLGDGERTVGGRGRTHLLVTQGPKDEGMDIVTRMPRCKKVLRRLVASDEHLSVVLVNGKGLAMPQSKEEMTAIMSFFSKHLYLRNLALEAMSDVYEVSMNPQ
ncbi:Alpha/Beta hydrolase protein [Entophlyctis helioformis]|nr:Alpha/Beta hydrolase protein [Entophlyctis helioformis]